MLGVHIPFGATVNVTWLDSVSKDGWVRVAEFTLPEVTEIRSRGFVVRSEADNPSLTISTSIADEQTAVIDPLSIPWAAVTHLETEDPPDGTTGQRDSRDISWAGSANLP